MSYKNIKFEEKIGEKIQEIRDESQKDITWIIFALNKGYTDAEFVEEGNDIEDMQDELMQEQDRIAFAYLRYSHSSCQKYVLVSFCHTSYGDKRNFVFVNKDVYNMLKKKYGVHVNVVAKTEEELEEINIKKQVSKAGGVSYGKK